MKRNSLLALIILLSPLCLQAKKKLPVLSTKQAANNLRFFTYDAKATYYQRRSGSLLRSTNYKVDEIISSEPGTHYVLKSTRHRKKIVGQMNPTYFSFMGVRNPKEIFVFDYKGVNLKKMGFGNNPQLHLDDQWVSFYNYTSRSLSFVSINDESKKISVNLNNTLNPFFLPQTLMLSPEKVIFTDLNSKGHPGVMQLDKASGKINVLFKLDNETHKIEICEVSSDSFIMGIFPLVNSKNQRSEISLLDTKSLDFSKRKILYSSKNNDIGNLICDFNQKIVYFVKEQISKGNDIYNAAELDIATGKVSVISDLNDVVSMNYIDGMLLVPDQGKLKILKGKKNLKEMDILGN